MKREVEELYKEFNASKVVLVGSIGKVKRIAREFDADIVILSRGVGKEAIEAVLENTEVGVLVV